MSAKRYTLKLTAIELDALCRLLWFVRMIGLVERCAHSLKWQFGWPYDKTVNPESRPGPWYRPSAAIERVFRQVDTVTDKVYDEGKMLRGYV